MYTLHPQHGRLEWEHLQADYQADGNNGKGGLLLLLLPAASLQSASDNLC